MARAPGYYYFLATRFEDSIMRKPGPPTNKEDDDGMQAMTCPWLLQFPRICEYITVDRWEDGSAREPSQLAIGMYDGGLRVSLNDRELKQSVYTQGETVVECLELLEGALQHDAARWYKWNRGKKAK